MTAGLGSVFVGPKGPRAGWRFLGYLGVSWALGTAVRLSLVATGWKPPSTFTAGTVAIGEAVQFGLAAIAVAIMARVERRPFGTYGLPARGAFGRLFWVGTLWGLVAVTVLVGLIAVLGGVRYGGIAEPNPAALARSTVLWTLAFIGVGLYEEIYFRGYALYTLASGMKFWPSAVLLSAVFAAMHFFLKPYENWMDALSVGLIGLFLCLTVRRTGTLWFAVGFHFAFDWAALFVFGAPNTANDGKSLEGHLLEVVWKGPDWLTGGRLGIEASALVFAVIAALFWLFPRRYPETRWPDFDAAGAASQGADPMRSAAAVLSLVAVVLLPLAGCSRSPATHSGLDESKLVDLSYPFDSTTIYWPTAEPFHLEVVSHARTPAGYWYASNNLCASEHGGTHLDAPIHFAEGGWTSDQIPVERLIGPAVVVDVADSCAANPDYRLRVDDLTRWEGRNGRIPDGAIVLMRSGWGARWPDRVRVFGSQTPRDVATLHFPGFSKEAAEFLTRERRVDAVGLDTPSMDYGQSRDFIAHQVFSAANVPGLENVAQLERLPERGATLIALPMKIAGGTGGPCRIVALLP